MGYTVALNNAVPLVSVHIHVHNLCLAARVYLESIHSQRLWSYCLEMCTCGDHCISIYITFYINASHLVILEAKWSVLPHPANSQKTYHCVDHD